MASLICRECDQELQGEDQDHLEDSLRAHYLGKNDGAHEYPGKQQFREMYGFTEEETSEQPQGSEEDSTIETDEQSPETDKTEQSGDSEDLLGVDEMEETDLDDLIDETEEEIDSSEESTQSKGLDTAVYLPGAPPGHHGPRSSWVLDCRARPSLQNILPYLLVLHLALLERGDLELQHSLVELSEHGIQDLLDVRGLDCLLELLGVEPGDLLL